MADYYSYNDPAKKAREHQRNHGGGGGATWLWAGIVLVAFVALIALGSTGGGTSSSGPETVGSAPTVAPDPQNTANQ